MADFWSDHYTNTALGSTTIDDPRIKVAAGLNHAKRRYKRATLAVTTATAAGDVLRFFKIKSSDRIIELQLSHDADASTTVNGDIGLYTVGAGGAVLDLDLYGDVLVAPCDDLTVVIGRTETITGDVFIGGVLTDVDRGLMAWEQLAIGAGTDTVDPILEYEVCLTIAAETGIVASEYVLECTYVPGTTA